MLRFTNKLIAYGSWLTLRILGLIIQKQIMRILTFPGPRIQSRISSTPYPNWGETRQWGPKFSPDTT